MAEETQTTQQNLAEQEQPAQPQEQQAQQMAPELTPTSDGKGKKNWILVIVAILVILVLLAVGSLYFFSDFIPKPSSVVKPTRGVVTMDSPTEGPSEEMGTEVSNLEQDFSVFEEELNALDEEINREIDINLDF